MGELRAIYRAGVGVQFIDAFLGVANVDDVHAAALAGRSAAPAERLCEQPGQQALGARERVVAQEQGSGIRVLRG